MKRTPKFPLHKYEEVIWEEVFAINNYRENNPNTYFNTTVDLTFAGGPKINLINVHKDFHDLLLEKFTLCEYDPSSPELCLFPRQVERPPYLGRVHSESKKFEVYDNSFGILKSIISGIASAMVQSQDWTPLHAACISVGGRTALLAGGSQSGKTTLVFEIAQQCLNNDIPFSILTDDWVVVQKIGSRIAVHSFDPTVSVDRGTLNNYGALFSIPDVVHEDILEDGRKHAISAFPGIKGSSQFSEYQVERIYALYPFDDIESPIDLEASDFAESAIACSYHYPYASRNSYCEHRDRWIDLSTCLLPKLIPTRAKSTTPKSWATCIISSLSK